MYVEDVEDIEDHKNLLYTYIFPKDSYNVKLIWIFGKEIVQYICGTVIYFVVYNLLFMGLRFVFRLSVAL